MSERKKIMRKMINTRPSVSRPAKIRGTHRYSFRHDEWGMLIGVRLITPKGQNERPCFEILYNDGFIDYKPISDKHNYEIGK